MIIPLECGICKEGATDFRSMISHYMSVHGMIFGRTVKHFELLPDLHDPSNYCRACEKSYKSIITYQHHLKSVHLIPKSFLNLQSAPDADPTHFKFRCNSCSETFMEQSKYYDHLKSIHDTSVKATIKAFDVLPDWNDANNHCKPCNYSFTTNREYHQHCLFVHQFPLPDPNDPNFHCKICNETHKDMVFYRNHCRKEHDMKDLAKITNIACKHCSSIFEKEKAYIEHVERFEKRLQKEALTEKEKRLQKEALKGKEKINPDFYDLNLYCSACDKAFKTRKTYGSHLKTVHSLILYSKPSQSLTKLKPNVSDPNFYCCTCQREYRNKAAYTQHLRSVHKIEKEYLEKFKDASVPKIFAHPLDPNLFNLVMLHLKALPNKEQSPLKSS